MQAAGAASLNEGPSDVELAKPLFDGQQVVQDDREPAGHEASARCPALFCPALFCPALPCPALPCPALPSPAPHSSDTMQDAGRLSYHCLAVCCSVNVQMAENAE